MGKLYKRNGLWYADYVDRDGKRSRRSTKLKDKQLAAKVLAKWEGDARLIQAGVKARTQHDESIESVLKLFESAKSAAGKTDQHVERTGQLIRAVAGFNQWTRVGDIDADGIAKYARHLQREEEQAARTVASMITAVRTFCKWCIPKYLTAEPTAAIQKPSSKSDRRIERRMLLPEEWKWLRAYLELVESFKNGQDSRERLLMYRVAIETGLRSSELRSLTRSSLHLAGKEPYIRVKASLTKNADEAKQYISDNLAADLYSRVRTKSPGSLVFHVVSRNEMARTLRNDIEEARELWLATVKDEHEKESDFMKSPNSQGEVIDFHALRHTCGAWLVMQGVTLAEVKEIMRHCSITLTVDCYGHLAPDARSRSRHVLDELL